jgi:tetratricopeptide (TPR) repeat protein
MPRFLFLLAVALASWSWTGGLSAARVLPTVPAARREPRAEPGGAETLPRPDDPLGGSLEDRLWADAADRRLDEFTLVEAVLIAGGVSDRQALRHHNRQLADWLEELRTAGAGQDRQARARTILEFMHRRILAAGFEPDGTSLATALDNGRFNCVSSTVLFLSLARGCGLEVEAVAEPAHVFCRLSLEQGGCDVQTTDPRAFQTSEHSVSRAAETRPLSEAGILALVYYNTGVTRLARGEFAQALSANQRALRLDPEHREARANLLAAYNNWAIESVREGKYRQALDLVRQARSYAKDEPKLLANQRAIYQKWAADHVHAGRFKEALAVLDEGLAELPGDGTLLESRHAVELRRMRAR